MQYKSLFNLVAVLTLLFCTSRCSSRNDSKTVMAPKHLGHSRYSLSKDWILKVLEDEELLFKAAARTKRDSNTSKIIGVEITKIAPGSFYEQVGLRIGDVLLSLNGVPAKDPLQISELFFGTANEYEKVHTVELQRKNKKNKFEYIIQ